MSQRAFLQLGRAPRCTWDTSAGRSLSRRTASWTSLLLPGTAMGSCGSVLRPVDLKQPEINFSTVPEAGSSRSSCGWVWCLLGSRTAASSPCPRLVLLLCLLYRPLLVGMPARPRRRPRVGSQNLRGTSRGDSVPRQQPPLRGPLRHCRGRGLASRRDQGAACPGHAVGWPLTLTARGPQSASPLPLSAPPPWLWVLLGG